MNTKSTFILALTFFLLAGAGRVLADGSVRDIRRSPSGQLWAAGDAGLLLTSADNGRNWNRRPIDPTANIEQLWLEPPRVFAIGGRAAPAYPGGSGRAVVLRSGDGGKTFAPLPIDAAGWAWGGIGSDDNVALGGQPTPRAPGAVFYTVSGGRKWTAVPLTSSGYLRGAAFRNFRYGYFVGQEHRIVSLKDLMEPRLHPADIETGVPLYGAAFLDAETCWAVGRDGTVLQSRPDGQRWARRPLPFPAQTQSLFDLDSIDAIDKSCLIAGGLTGLMFHSADGGKTFRTVPAPGPGPVRCLRQTSATEWFVGGDGGRIWRTTDAGESWQQLRGPQRCDVLFIAAAGDTSIYPAVVTHAQAGLDVAILYASAPQRPGHEAELGTASISPGQQLRAAAMLAGAGGAMVFDDIPSLLLDPAASPEATAEDVLERWSAALDRPAERVLLRQLVAAIRLYRPRVVATGPAGEGPVGVRAENRLVARLAARAVSQAAEDDVFDELKGVNLAPHKVGRLFVGIQENESWQAPWLDTRDLPPHLVTRIDATRWPEGADATVELLAQRAVWAIGDAGLLDRPGRFGGYYCKQADGSLPMMTTGLAESRLRGRRVPHAVDTLCSAANFRLAETLRRPLTVLNDVMDAAKADRQSQLLAADRLLLAWARLRATGRLAASEEARKLFFQLGMDHPWYERMQVGMLAEWCSTDFAGQWARVGGRRPVTPERLNKLAEAFAGSYPWRDAPVGMLLGSRGAAATQHGGEAFTWLQALTDEPFPDRWRELARREQKLFRGKLPERDGEHWLEATAAGPDGRVDGRLDEPAWAKARPVLLRTADGTTGDATLQILRTPGDLVLGLRLKTLPGRSWSVAVAIDADRDARTQLVLEFNDLGQLSETLRTRYLPPATVPRVKHARPLGPIGSWAIRPDRDVPQTAFDIQAPRKPVDGWLSFEIALPIHYVQDPRNGGIWALQVRAMAEKATEETVFYLRPQDDGRLLPERYSLLVVPGPDAAATDAP